MAEQASCGHRVDTVVNDPYVLYVQHDPYVDRPNSAA